MTTANSNGRNASDCRVLEVKYGTLIGVAILHSTATLIDVGDGRDTNIDEGTVGGESSYNWESAAFWSGAIREDVSGDANGEVATLDIGVSDRRRTNLSNKFGWGDDTDNLK